MSGKAPPRAPRALLNSLNASSSSASTSTATPSQPIPSSSSSSSRLGATPPTGPRSLTNPQRQLHPQRQPLSKPFLNGHVAIPTGPAAATPSLPTGPSARYSQKGKQVDSSYQIQHPPPSTSSPSSNTNPSLNSNTAGGDGATGAANGTCTLLSRIGP
ncbi:hypothetical protein NLI96_g12340 [Meripilus lineatus]|uniref:Uncharacterized protein n=1 Tax=Meripilus lineatus TaxID=2056292 RepID=A0AAD5UQ34_9APHY|nr:hypothetical protein NLI96_g12340 [Physisporinus lineatus]